MGAVLRAVEGEHAPFEVLGRRGHGYDLAELWTDIAEAVSRVSFGVGRGEILCLVGESGSGKSVIAQSVMGLLPRTLPVTGGRVLLDGEDLTQAAPGRLRRLRATRMSMIFQEPMTALNPVMRCGEQIDEVLREHTAQPAAERRARALAIIREVRLPDPQRIANSYPHQLPVGSLVAETAVQAKDAAEAVELDIEPLPAVTLPSAAAQPGAPQLYDDVPGNVALDFLYGDPQKVAQAFAQAFYVGQGYRYRVRTGGTEVWVHAPERMDEGTSARIAIPRTALMLFPRDSITSH